MNFGFETRVTCREVLVIGARALGFRMSRSPRIAYKIRFPHWYSLYKSSLLANRSVPNYSSIFATVLSVPCTLSSNRQ